MIKFLNKFFVSLSLLVVLNFYSNATTYSGKTFLRSRPVIDNMAVEYSIWNQFIKNKNENQSGANFALTGFYQESLSGHGIGKYFGINNKNKFEIGYNPSDYAVFYRFIFHDYFNSGPDGDGQTNAILKFDPKNSIYGVRLDYYQNLDFILKNLFLKIATPFIHVKNDLNMSINNSTGLFADGKLKKYFAGNYQNFDVTTLNLQTKLTHAKVDGKREATGFADVDFKFGYKLFNEKRFDLNFNLDLTIPTGNKVKGKYLFQPVVGSGNHIAIGAGIDSIIKVWQNKKQYFDFSYAVNYKYLLEATEKRTLSANNKNGFNFINFSQYFLVGQIADADTPLIPAANVLTQDLKVTPASQLEFLTSLAYGNGNFSIELGYNLFGKESEDLKLKSHWDNAKYYFADMNFQTNQEFTSQDGYPITFDNLILDSAKTPYSLNHKVFTSIGYISCKKLYNIMGSIGASYEFTIDSNSDFDNWAAWAKLGLAF